MNPIRRILAALAICTSFGIATVAAATVTASPAQACCGPRFL